MKNWKVLSIMSLCLFGCDFGDGFGGGSSVLPSVDVSGSAGSGASLFGGEFNENEDELSDDNLGTHSPDQGVVQSLLADSNINVSELWIKPVQFWVSTSALCTNPIKVFDAGSLADAEEADFTRIPPIGSGELPSGTYNCLIMVMSDQVRFLPASNSSSGNCSATTHVTIDVCNNNSVVTYTLPDGTTGTCQGGIRTSRVEQMVAVYISTGSTSTNPAGANAFQAPTSASDSTKGLNLTSPLIIGGSSASTQFVADTTGKVQDSSGSCDMQPPVWGFQ